MVSQFTDTTSLLMGLGFVVDRVRGFNEFAMPARLSLALSWTYLEGPKLRGVATAIDPWNRYVRQQKRDGQICSMKLDYNQ